MPPRRGDPTITSSQSYRETEFVVMTQVQPDSLPGRGVPWWVILLAVLGGLLLLCLLAYGLYKVSGVL